MARPRSAAVALRDDGIYAAWRGGATLQQLADEHGVTPQRIGQIVAVRHPEFDDDTDRSLHRGRLENLFQDMQQVNDAPGWICGPNGRVVAGPEGEPLVAVGTRIEAAKVQLAILESLRKLDGRDKPSKRVVTMEHTVAEQQYIADIAAKRAEMERLQRGHVIRGEIEPPSAEAS